LQRSCDDERGAPFCIGRLILVRDAITRGTANEILKIHFGRGNIGYCRTGQALQAMTSVTSSELFTTLLSIAGGSYLALKTNLCNYLVWIPIGWLVSHLRSGGS
jgi:hypothetical protein